MKKMTGDEIFERVRKITAAILKVPPGSITYKSRYIDDLAADSLNIYQVISALEEDFCEEIEDAAVERLTTIGKTVAYIETILESGGAKANPE